MKSACTFSQKAFLITILLPHRAIRIATGLLVIPFVPSSNLLPVGFVVADRVLYIPSIGYCLLIAVGIHRLTSTQPQWRRLIVVTIVAVFVLRANERAMDWLNDYQLFLSGVRVCPANAKIFYNLGQVTGTQKNFNASIQFNTMANELRPGNQATLNNLGNAYRNAKDLEMALKYHREAVAIK